jgi:3-hydroxybutyrate dehydrogenase
VLNGRTAFVTGGGRGIGRAIALAFAREGAVVAVAARSRDQIEAVAAEIEGSGRSALAVECDVTKPASVTGAFERAAARMGRIDILVNNAGIAESAPLARLDEDLWARTLDVNLTGTYRCTRAALGGMVARGFGRVINVASVAGRVGHPYIAAYCASKHGVLGFTRAVALEVATRGVTVNAICPGFVETDMTESGIAKIVERTGRSAEETRRTLEALSPQRRIIRPEEVAAVALFLASDAAHGITGQAINVDGGQVMA